MRLTAERNCSRLQSVKYGLWGPTILPFNVYESLLSGGKAAGA